MLPIGICVKYNTIKLKDGKKYIMLILTQKSPWNGNINVRKVGLTSQNIARDKEVHFSAKAHWWRGHKQS